MCIWKERRSVSAEIWPQTLDLTETFVQMGIDELSVAPGQVLALRKKIREIQ